MADDDGFLSRWSRRKAQVARTGTAADAPAPPPVPPVPVALAVSPAPPAVPADAAPAAEPVAEAAPPPPLTLDDVAALGKESDYSRFVARDVDPGVRNAAVKKLFASDPHFNTMDGLDVYIDDYNKFEPVPRSILRQLVNARTLGLIDDDLEEQPAPDNSGAADTAVAAPAAEIANENPDLQLQPHDAAGPRGPGEGVADGGSAESAAPDAVPPRGA